MRDYVVWDAINASEETASTISALNEFFAAREYAEADTDGVGDGLYSGHGHPVLVRDPEGKVHKLRVIVDFDPVFTAIRDE